MPKKFQVNLRSIVTLKRLSWGAGAVGSIMRSSRVCVQWEAWRRIGRTVKGKAKRRSAVICKAGAGYFTPVVVQRLTWVHRFTSVLGKVAFGLVGAASG